MKINFKEKSNIISKDSAQTLKFEVIYTLHQIVPYLIICCDIYKNGIALPLLQRTLLRTR